MNNLQQRIEQSKEVFEKIQRILAHKPLDLDDRKIVGMGYLSSSLEYHAAMHLLFSQNRNGAAAALMRPQFESYVKAVWFIHCSTDSQVNKAHEDKFDKEFQKIISGIEHKKVPGWEDIKSLKDSYWKLLCGFTHTGKPQLARRFNGQSITPNYESEFVKSALNLADIVAFRTLLEILSSFSVAVEEGELVDLLHTTEVLKAFLEPASDKSRQVKMEGCASV